MIIVRGLSTEVGPYHYTTNQMLKQLGDLIPEKTQDQIKRLGVQARFFNTPLTDFIKEPYYDVEPIDKRNERDIELCMTAIHRTMFKTDLLPPQIDNIICGYERADWLSPGLSSILIAKLGLKKYIPFYNLQGHACSTFPRIIEFAKKLHGRTLCVISGVTSPWYQNHWKDPGKIDEKDPNSWVNTIFSFLFGDGVAAFIVEPYPQYSNVDGEQIRANGYKIGQLYHYTNLDEYDYSSAAVRIEEHGIQAYAPRHVIDTTLRYTDEVLTDMHLQQQDVREYDQIFLHTGSAKIIEAYRKYYNLSDDQLQSSRVVLAQHGNLTGCSLPFVLNNATFNKGKALMIGIAMGFSVDICEVYP